MASPSHRPLNDPPDPASFLRREAAVDSPLLLDSDGKPLDAAQQSLVERLTAVDESRRRAAERMRETLESHSAGISSQISGQRRLLLLLAGLMILLTAATIGYIHFQTLSRLSELETSIAQLGPGATDSDRRPVDQDSSANAGASGLQAERGPAPVSATAGLPGDPAPGPSRHTEGPEDIAGTQGFEPASATEDTQSAVAAEHEAPVETGSNESDRLKHRASPTERLADAPPQARAEARPDAERAAPASGDADSAGGEPAGRVAAPAVQGQADGAARASRLAASEGAAIAATTAPPTAAAPVQGTPEPGPEQGSPPEQVLEAPVEPAATLAQGARVSAAEIAPSTAGSRRERDAELRARAAAAEQASASVVSASSQPAAKVSVAGAVAVAETVSPSDATSVVPSSEVDLVVQPDAGANAAPPPSPTAIQGPGPTADEPARTAELDAAEHDGRWLTDSLAGAVARGDDPARVEALVDEMIDRRLEKVEQEYQRLALQVAAPALRGRDDQGSSDSAGAPGGHASDQRRSLLAETMPPPEQLAVRARPVAIQLIGFFKREELEAFVREKPMPTEVYVLEETFRGRPWFALLHSLHRDRAAALGAVRELPPALAKLEPWVRALPVGTELDVLVVARAGQDSS